MKVAEKLADRIVVGALCDDFHAIARGKDHRFIDLVPARQRGQSIADTIAGERQPLPYFYGCCFVAESDECELHCWLKTVEPAEVIRAQEGHEDSDETHNRKIGCLSSSPAGDQPVGNKHHVNEPRYKREQHLCISSPDS